ncbi:MAG: cupin domain-containing protein [Bacillota bacterium]
MNTRDLQSRREAFYERIDPHSMAPLWTRLKSLVPAEPTPIGVPHRWRYAQVRPYVLESAQHISAAEAERRVLILENPALRGTSQVTSTLYAGLQLIMPGEVAPPHRHTQSALRFIVEGRGAYTTVEGEKVLMEPGDFVITPSWTWHHHGNETQEPMIWLDGLDIPMLAHFNSTFREDHREGEPPVHPPANRPIVSYPWSRTREALRKLAASTPDSHLGHVMRYLTPAGEWAMPTIAPVARLLPGGFQTRAYRSSDSAIFIVVEGTGDVEVGGQRFDLAEHDIFVVPGWMPCTMRAASDLVLFSFSDRVAQEKLGIFREDRS